MNYTFIVLRKFSAVMLMLLIIMSCSEKKQQSYGPMEIPVVKVIQQDIPIYQDFIGQIYGQFDIPIRARVSGFLDAIHFQEGYWVKKGQLLYTIDPQPLEANLAGEMSRLAEKKTELAKAESDLGRIVPLAKINAVSKSDLDATQAQYNAAKANVKAVESSVRIANINLSYCWIKSPISGLIGKTQAKVGEFVGQDPNPVILNTVSTIDTVHVEFYLVEADYLGLARKFIESSRQKEDADYIEREATRDSELTLILSDGSIFNHKGHVNFIDRQVNPETGSLLIQTSFPNPDQLLRPGQYAKVRAKMDVLKDAIMIPQRCVMELQGTHSVYIVNDSSIVKSRQIVTGSKYEDYWIINKGLKANDKVVINALQKVAPGMPVIPKITDFENKTTTQ
jgi:membrane fusion protein (multidrug efflux system)